MSDNNNLSDELRTAATLMRKQANAAPPGPWTADKGEIYSQPSGEWIAETLYLSKEDATLDPAAHIASWHPTVALAVADWLDFTAAWTRDVDPSRREVQTALTVARAYLHTAVAG